MDLMTMTINHILLPDYPSCSACVTASAANRKIVVLDYLAESNVDGDEVKVYCSKENVRLQ